MCFAEPRGYPQKPLLCRQQLRPVGEGPATFGTGPSPLTVIVADVRPWCDRWVFRPKERSVEESVQIAAPVDRVWDALLDPQAMLWIMQDCVFAVAVPGEQAAVGAVRCGWRKKRNGSSGAAVLEVVDLERPSRVVFRDTGRPERRSRIEFYLEPDLAGTRVTVVIRQRRRDWASGEATLRGWVKQTADGLGLAAGGNVLQ